MFFVLIFRITGPALPLSPAGLGLERALRVGSASGPQGNFHLSSCLSAESEFPTFFGTARRQEESRVSAKARLCV